MFEYSQGTRIDLEQILKLGTLGKASPVSGCDGGHYEQNRLDPVRESFIYL